MKKITLNLVLMFLNCMLFAQIPTEGLILHFDFSGNANNSVSNNHHGQILGPVLTTDRFGVSNEAYLFDGIDDLIEVEDHLELRPQAISFSFWISLYEEKDRWQAIISKFDSNQTGNGNYVVATEGESRIHSAFHYGSICDSGDDWERDTTSIVWNLLDWDHIVVTYDGSVRKYYQNGQEINSNSINTNFSSCSGSALRIGGNMWYSDGQFFEGKLDEVRIYDRALTSQEVEDIYSIESTPPTSVNDYRQNLVTTFFPNPVKNILYFTNKRWRGNMISYKILNINGNVVKRGPIIDDSIDVSDLTQGVYIIEVVKSDKSQSYGSRILKI